MLFTDLFSDDDGVWSDGGWSDGGWSDGAGCGDAHLPCLHSYCYFVLLGRLALQDRHQDWQHTLH